jgi:phosphatidylserine/phosphatidylglycerophosphate/cardiolipin synthase-like enzyme
MDQERFIISTANLSYTSMRRNREYWFVSSHPGIVASLNTIFAKDRRGSMILRRDIHPDLLLCPEDCRSKLFSALRDADESIWIAAQYIQDEQLVDLLEHKSESLDVRLLV